jgi:outer membrane murein-binding lipoprotein Lpp
MKIQWQRGGSTWALVNGVRAGAIALTAMLLLAGCASTAPTDPKQIAKRRTEKAAAYAALSSEHQVVVDQGQIRVGLPEDAVYISWGKPAQVLRSGDASGETITWLYEGTTTDDYLSWNYREVIRKDGTTYLDRFLDRDINVRTYVSAELLFRDGKLASWKMMPKPGSNTILAPQPFLR